MLYASAYADAYAYANANANANLLACGWSQSKKQAIIRSDPGFDLVT